MRDRIVMGTGYGRLRLQHTPHAWIAQLTNLEYLYTCSCHRVMNNITPGCHDLTLSICFDFRV